MKKKNFSGSIKAMDEKGTGRAVFATTGVWDKDQEWTLPGAFGEQTAKLVGAHNWGVPNIGSVKIHEEGQNAIADFQFYLDMPSAKEWYFAEKNNFDRGVPSELSYGFDVTEEERGEHDGRTGRVLKKLKVWEVSFVMVGAGVGTRVTAMKAYAQLRGTWEETQAAIRDAAHQALLGDNTDGWVSVEGTYSDRVVVSSYRDGEANCYQFNWAEQPDGSVALTDRVEVEIAAIVREKASSIEAHFGRAVDEVWSIQRRCEALAAMRAKEGRVLSRANRDRLGRLLAQISQAQEEMDKLLRETDPDDEGKARIQQAVVRAALAEAALNGHL